MLADTKTITFRAIADSSVDLSLVDYGGVFSSSDTVQDVDFDTLTSGESLSYDTLVRSNDGYSVSFQSLNGQVLKHTGNTSTVSYGVTFDGASTNLPAGVPMAVKTHSGTTPAAGDRMNTVFTVGTLTGAEPPGTYKDTITVTISAH